MQYASPAKLLQMVAVHTDPRGLLLNSREMLLEVMLANLLHMRDLVVHGSSTTFSVLPEECGATQSNRMAVLSSDSVACINTG